MRRVIAISATVALLSAITGVASLQFASAEPATLTSKTLHLTAELNEAHELDLGAVGTSEGDQFVFHGTLFTTTATPKQIGRLSGVCVITRFVSSAVLNAGQCQMTAVLSSGQIAVEGEWRGVPAPSSFTNGVTGGTGSYKTALGEVEGAFLSATTIDLVFKLLLA